MAALILGSMVLCLVLLGVSAVLYGADSTRYDKYDHRPWWPGAPRR
jgi:hypothetical protein